MLRSTGPHSERTSGGTTRKIGRPAQPADLARYLSGELEGEFARDGGDIASLWSKTRNSTRRIARKGMDTKWEMVGDTLMPTIDHQETRQTIVRQLRQSHREKYERALLQEPDQGKPVHCFTESEASNHFLRSGFATRFADWRFIHRARLDCVPLNATRRFGEGDKRCRRCGYTKETLPHVLCHCKLHSAAWQRRHNNIQDRIVAALPKVDCEVAVNKQHENTELGLDIVFINRRANTALVLDITVPFENTQQAFQDAREEKSRKYLPVVDELRKKGLTADVDAIIVGCLGSWDPMNDDPLRLCGIRMRYTQLMKDSYAQMEPRHLHRAYHRYKTVRVKKKSEMEL